MVSAVLGSGRRSSWGQSVGGFMGKKLPHPNHPNPNPNPSSTPKNKKFRSLSDRSTSLAQALDDEHSFNQTPVESRDFSEFNHDQYNTFDIGSSTRNELIELKKRLVDELEEVRRLKDDIDNGKFHSKLVPEKRQKVSGNKRPIEKLVKRPLERDLKGLLSETTIGDRADGFVVGGGEIVELMKMCRGVLAKLMKLKNSWIFKDPVDAVALGLHDYHEIVKKPMDLGTVRSNCAKNVYSSPEEFAADVRLTFENAMLYNPKGDEVHKMAEELIDRFDVLYRPIGEKFESMIKPRDGGLSDGLQEEGNSWNQVLKPERKKKPKLDSIQNLEKKYDSPVLKSPIREPRAKPGGGGGNRGKLPKPKAKDPSKREMSMDEKERLGVGLQNLPQEKMPQLVQIIRKKNAHMAPEGDEIELDIEAIDTETLWELDRFLLVSEKADAVEKGEGREEEVGIDDEMPVTSFPPVEIEKDNGGHVDMGLPATRSSSSSGSDSSSDSDSGSSSGSDSDADDAQSRGLESKKFSETSGELEPRDFSQTGGV
ncbi:hypothetical protein RHMOL_Rhmol05G0119500 [Rhododendron molle]|uniref:Uncharacterized protein n=1 Tax=Rhododendron molle TaxID=49168 RepID=A0ACC0NN78_RHOML|nr:hypothetical protein RHMOL_Rhmol05G0119500 [Rhododendron molle]